MNVSTWFKPKRGVTDKMVPTILPFGLRMKERRKIDKERKKRKRDKVRNRVPEKKRNRVQRNSLKADKDH